MTHIAHMNWGRLLHDWDDPRVADFMNALDTINGLGKRMAGFVWMMEGSGEPGSGNTENKINGDELLVPNLTVWQDVASLEEFVWDTVHRQFYERRAEWFEVLGDMGFVMWWVLEGHQPTLEEALARLDHKRQHGDSDQAFGWSYLKDATKWRQSRCKQEAAA
ncbi:MAG: DUF3291 domain-containing protein [Alphaproteobacteria bacterium]|nr:DUF3291 domain-containing protein [Alphaproteobacteria bacterium]